MDAFDPKNAGKKSAGKCRPPHDHITGNIQIHSYATRWIPYTYVHTFRFTLRHVCKY